MSENPIAPSSAINYLIALSEALVERRDGHEYFLLVSPRNRHLFARAAEGGARLVNCYVSNEKIPLRVAVQQTLVPMLLREHGVDVIVGYNVVPLLARSAKVVKVSTLHHHVVPEQFTRNRIRFYYRRLAFDTSARAADVVIANSDYTREAIIRYMRVAPDRVVVVPESVGDEFTHERDPGRARDEVQRRFGLRGEYVLFVSTLWRYKNAETLIRAFARLVSEPGTTWELALAGRRDDASYCSELDALIKGCGLDERVRFLGEVPNADLPWLFRAARVHVNPSRAETFGKTVVEAMRCATPTVASNTTSLREMVGDAALLVDPEDDAAMAIAIHRVATDEALRTRLIEAGLARATEFSWDRTAELTVRACEEALRRRNRRSSPAAQPTRGR